MRVHPLGSIAIAFLSLSLMFTLQPAKAQEKKEAEKGADSNLLTNGKFESGSDGWELIAFHKQGEMMIDQEEKYRGSPTLRITNAGGDDTFVKQKVKVKPNTRYRLTGFVKTKDVEAVKRNDKNGACLAVAGGHEKTPSIAKTKTWSRVTHEFATGGETEIEVGPRLGFYSANVTGTAWFSDITLQELGRARR